MSSRLDKLKEEADVLEKAAFGNPESSKIEELATKPEEKEVESSELLEQPVETIAVESQTKDSIETLEKKQPEEEEVIKEKPQRTNWKKRYRNFKASTDATIHKLRQENVILSSENLKLSEKIDELSAKLVEIPQTVVDPLTPEEREILGDDAVSSLQKLVDAKVKAIVDPLQDQLKTEKELRKESQIAALEINQKATADSFLERLEDIIPDCLTIDANPQFLNWMKEIEPESGLVREEIFKTSKATGDVVRVAGFFNDWKTLQNQGETILDKHLTPSKQVTTSQIPRQPNQPEIIPAAEIMKFYDDVARGRYRGQGKIKEEMQAKYDKALVERRVS